MFLDEKSVYRLLLSLFLRKRVNFFSKSEQIKNVRNKNKRKRKRGTMLQEDGKK